MWARWIPPSAGPEDIKTSIVNSETVVNAKGVKFNPFPLYTKVTTSYPSPVMAYLAAVGGIAATLGGMFGIVHTVHLEMLKRKDAIEAARRDEPSDPILRFPAYAGLMLAIKI